MRDRIAFITLDRPQVLNALTDDMIRDLRAKFCQLDDDPTAVVGILSGEGRAFSSGADVRQRQLRPAAEMVRLGGAQGRGAFVEDVLELPTDCKPILAAVHGYVMGAALYIALRLDLIVAARGTRFQITEVSRGVDASNFWALLANRASEGFATDVALTGRFWTAEEALANHAIDRLVPDGRHLSVAEELAGEIARRPTALTRTVVMARRWTCERTELRARLSKNHRLQLSEDFRESALAFVEKRAPRFKGR